MRRPISYLLLLDKKNATLAAERSNRRLLMTTVTISLPESLKQFVDAQVASKGYGNVSEYFRSLLRDAQEREAEARLEALLLEGLASGDPIPVTEKFWSDLRAEAEQRVKARKAGKKRG
jgi:antitoxin ParD1/3/4